MRLKQSRLILLGMGIVAAASTYSIISDAQSNSNHVAVANDVNQHIHSLALRGQDVVDALTNVNEGLIVNFDSSTGYYEGIQNGTSHSHQINLTAEQLQELQNNGNVNVVSEINLGHQHTFTFLSDPQCQQVLPSPSPSPSVIPSPEPSPTVSPSPSPSVSLTPIL